MFKDKRLIRLIKESNQSIAFIIPKYKLTVILQDTNILHVQFNGGFYTIQLEKKTCNLGGFLSFLSLSDIALYRAIIDNLKTSTADLYDKPVSYLSNHNGNTF